MDAAVVAAWAAVAAAVIGPLIGVHIAHTFARYDATRNEAARLFRTILEDCQNYRISFDDAYADKEHLQRAHSGSLELLEAFSKAFEDTKESIAQPLDTIANALISIEERALQSSKELRSRLAALNADMLSLRLLFGSEAEKCEKAVKQLAETYEMLDLDVMPADAELEQLLNRLIDNIVTEMKPIHEAMVRSDPLATSDDCARYE